MPSVTEPNFLADTMFVVRQRTAPPGAHVADAVRGAAR